MEERETELNVMFIVNEFIDTIINWKNTILLETNNIYCQVIASIMTCVENKVMVGKIQIQICKVNERLV